MMHVGSLARSIPGFIGPLLLASALLIGGGCGGRTVLLYAVRGTTGGAAGESPGTGDAGTGGTADTDLGLGTGGSVRPDVGAEGGSSGAGENRDGGADIALDVGGKEPIDVGPDVRRDGVASEGADAGRDRLVDGGLDAALDGTVDVRRDARNEAGQPDGANPVDSGGRLNLFAGGLGGPGYVDGMGAAARFHAPHGVAIDGAGNLFVADVYNSTIRKVVIATGEVTTLAGSPGQHGSLDGNGAAAHFYYPNGVACDGAGNLFVVDTDNNTIRKVVIATGEVTTLAGAAAQMGGNDGNGAAARFYLPEGIASDGAGNLFVADSYNHTIRKVVMATGEVTTLAGSPGRTGSSDGTGAAARFYYPNDVASDGAGNLFVADERGQTIRKVVVATGEVTTFAGSPGQTGSTDGTRAAARFDGLHGMASDGAGNLFVADSENRTIRKVIITTGAVTTFVGSPGEAESSDGTGVAARFRYPYGVASNGAGHLFVADSDNHTIRKVVITTGEVTTLAGSPDHAGSNGGTGAAARFNTPNGIASDGAGMLFVADSVNHAIRRVIVATGEVTALAGSPEQAGSSDGIGAAARFNTPNGVASDGAGNLFVADSENRTIRKVVMATGEVTTLAGSAGQWGSDDGTGAAARFSRPSDVAIDGAGNLFVSDTYNHTIRKVVLATGEVTTLAGSAGQWGSDDGTGAAARFDMPYGMANDRAGNLFVADYGNYTIRKVVIATGEVTTFAGSPQQAGSTDGTGTDARFALPTGMASDGAGNLFVADTGNHAIRKIAIGPRTVTTVVGAPDRAGVFLGPLPAGLRNPWSLALGPAGELYISEAEENAILVAQF